jgi:Ribonuclease G/E
MSDSIKDTVPKVLKTLWDLETELRGAAQNGVILRREEASKHLAEARRHLDELLGLTRSPETTTETSSPAESSTTNSSDNRI